MFTSAARLKERGATFKPGIESWKTSRTCESPKSRPSASSGRSRGILDAADALRAKRREALAQFDTLLQSIFLDMFGDPVTNPMGWPIATVGEVWSMYSQQDYAPRTRKPDPSGSALNKSEYVG